MATRRATRKKSRGARAAVAPATRGKPPVHNAFELSNQEIESALQTGEHAGLLEDYFGRESYLELTRLAREAATRKVRGGPIVWILPGLMGTKLGHQRVIRVFDDVIWFDPVDVALGNLTELALPAGSRLRTLGVILFVYLRLKFRLERAGYHAEFHEFDWRLGINKLGNELKARLDTRDGANVNLVAHSMGGMVARWALQEGAKCRRLIMLGTPNFGSFAPVQAFRAAYPTVRKLGTIDQRHEPEDLAREVFNTFPGLTQLLPFRERYADLDLFSLETWPAADGLRPRPALLKDAASVQEKMNANRTALREPGMRDKVFVIAGVDRDTTVGVKKGEDGQFVYETSTAGDGTVPLRFAELPEAAKHYYIPEAHGSLPNNGLVARAVLELLDRGVTSVLPDSYSGARRAAVTTVTEAQLRVDPYPNRRGGSLSQRELRHALEEVASPAAQDDLVPVPGVPTAPVALPAGMGPPALEPGYRHTFDRVVVGRRRQHRVEIRFAFGDVTETDSRAIALGIFRDVAPTGAARALDVRLGGAITDMTRRRMFSAGVGEVFMMPKGRHSLMADLVAFVGLGPFDRFNHEVLQTAAENVLRTFVSTRVEEFGTVLFGAGSGEEPADALRHLLTGFFRGLRDADHDHQFRRIVVCEKDPARYLQLKEEVYRLSSTALCHDVEITFDEVTLRAPLAAAPLPARRTPGRDPVYLIVRQERQAASRGRAANFDVRSAILTAGAKATVVTGLKGVKQATFDQLRDKIVNGDGDFAVTGRKMAELLMDESVLTVLPTQRDRHLVVVHDAAMSRVPWETLAFKLDGAEKVWQPAAKEGLSRRYAADNLSVAKWLEDRVRDNQLSVLLVVNPTRDLDGAEEEGKRVSALFRQLRCQIDEMWRENATRPALLAAFSSGKYDLIHYAGHAFFDEASPERSGIICHGHVPLSGVDLAGLSNLPSLVFFNACESGRLRGKTPRANRDAKDRKSHLRDAVGLAEAFMRGGVANFLGTYWPVGDAAAATFAPEFYKRILGGERIGDAVQAARRAVEGVGSPDWADYIFYGNHDFVLKEVAPDTSREPAAARAGEGGAAASEGA